MEPMRYTTQQSWEVTEQICENFALSSPQRDGPDPRGVRVDERSCVNRTDSLGESGKVLIADLSAEDLTISTDGVGFSRPPDSIPCVLANEVAQSTS